MSFIGVVEQDLAAVDAAALAEAKNLVGYVENVVVVDLLPVLETALMNAINTLGQEATAALLAATGQTPTTQPTDTAPAS